MNEYRAILVSLIDNARSDLKSPTILARPTIRSYAQSRLNTLEQVLAIFDAWDMAKAVVA